MDESLSPYQSKKSELTVEGGCVLWGMRMIIPVKLREQLLTFQSFWNQQYEVNSRELYVVARLG